MQQHDQTLEAFVEQIRNDPEALAVVLVGSVARGRERSDSDVDVYLVLTEEGFARRREVGELSYTRTDVASYEGGYIDVKVASQAYLEAAVERADEPARASFLEAKVVWSKLPQLHLQLEAITRLPEAEWARREQSFIAQIRLFGGYFLPQGAQLDDRYLRSWAALHLVNAAARALLARDRVLFAGPKYLRSSVRALPALPEDFDRLADQLLAEPTPELGYQFLIAVETFLASPLPQEQTLSRFVGDNELAWLTREPTPEYF